MRRFTSRGPTYAFWLCASSASAWPRLVKSIHRHVPRVLMYTKRLLKSTYTKRPFKSLGCCEGMGHMVLQRAHRKDHGLRSDARIMGHHPPDYGCPSEAGHRGLLSKGCCLSEAGHLDAQEHALGAHVHKKTPQNPTQLLASVLQPRLSNGHEPWTIAYI